MRCWRTIVGVGLAAAFVGGCGTPGGRVSPSTPGIVGPEVLAKASLKYYWQYQVPMDWGERIERIWRLDENVYGLTDRNRLIAVEAATGLYKWHYPVAEPGKKVFGICHADGVKLAKGGGIKIILDPPDPSKIDPVDGVVVNTLSHMLLINRQSGELMRKHEFKFACNGPGCSDGIYFFVGSARGWYYPVRLVDGLTPWTGGTGDMITAPPVWYKRILYVVSRDSRLYAIKPYEIRDRRLWVRQAEGPMITAFHIDKRGLFVGSEDFNLYAYDPLDGTRLWTYRTQGSLREPVQVGERSIFQWADQDRFYALDIARGQKRWELKDGHFAMGVIEPYAYILTWNRQLKVVHEFTGKLAMVLPMNGLDLFVRNAAKPVLYAATARGRFVCITPSSAGHLTAKDLKD